MHPSIPLAECPQCPKQKPSMATNTQYSHNFHMFIWKASWNGRIECVLFLFCLLCSSLKYLIYCGDAMQLLVCQTCFFHTHTLAVIKITNILFIQLSWSYLKWISLIIVDLLSTFFSDLQISLIYIISKIDKFVLFFKEIQKFTVHKSN